MRLTPLKQQMFKHGCINDLWSIQAQLQSSAAESSEAELSLHAEMRGLRSELDEAKRRLSKLNQERQELSLRLENSERDKQALKQTVSQLEDTKSQLGKALDKLNKDVRYMKVFNQWVKLVQSDFLFNFCCLCPLTVRVSQTVLEGGGARPQCSAGGAKRASTQGDAGCSTPRKRCAIWAGKASCQPEETGRRSAHLCSFYCGLFPKFGL